MYDIAKCLLIIAGSSSISGVGNACVFDKLQYQPLFLVCSPLLLLIPILIGYQMQLLQSMQLLEQIIIDNIEILLIDKLITLSEIKLFVKCMNNFTIAEEQAQQDLFQCDISEPMPLYDPYRINNILKDSNHSYPTTRKTKVNPDTQQPALRSMKKLNPANTENYNHDKTGSTHHRGNLRKLLQRLESVKSPEKTKCKQVSRTQTLIVRKQMQADFPKYRKTSYTKTIGRIESCLESRIRTPSKVIPDSVSEMLVQGEPSIYKITSKGYHNIMNQRKSQKSKQNDGGKGDSATSSRKIKTLSCSSGVQNSNKQSCKLSQQEQVRKLIKQKLAQKKINDLANLLRSANHSPSAKTVKMTKLQAKQNRKLNAILFP